ncbi:MAG: heparan-alpha-glucosaminide N-acetyltransferase domain-containing protein [Peptoniphilaceae bacterium]|nr:heparan-alpha-glucosaminide N-acetyltransferase domain-containing protein [Peptoniphilaceae bacterium]MDY6018623.1 heparan-alpha-glucosaminide N-acetyltransferase domain-containing protein [Anaerococcus sp.]
MKRNYLIDQIRGFTIISMVLFHLCYDINLYRNLAWYDNTLFNHIWQLSIAIAFFTISGIVSNFLSYQSNIKRGIKISLLGFLISAITYFFDKDLLILFGVLNGLGLSMILTGLIQKKLKIDPKFSIVFLVLFIIFYRLPNKQILAFNIDSKLYDMNLFPLGFPNDSFYSTDYFPIIPWFFIYFFGLLIGKIFIKSKFFNKSYSNNLLAKIGQHSIEIYLAHQVIIYLLVYSYFNFLA